MQRAHLNAQISYSHIQIILLFLSIIIMNELESFLRLPPWISFPDGSQKRFNFIDEIAEKWKFKSHTYPHESRLMAASYFPMNFRAGFSLPEFFKNFVK